VIFQDLLAVGHVFYQPSCFFIIYSTIYIPVILNKKEMWTYFYNPLVISGKGKAIPAPGHGGP
jgi:hypothetical protein